MKIGFGKELPTKDVEAYALGWCREFANLFAKFVRKPKEETCVHCLPNTVSNPTVLGETFRRCAERVHLEDTIDSWVYELDQDASGEVVIRAKAMTECLMTMTTNPGARCERHALPQQNVASSFEVTEDDFPIVAMNPQEDLHERVSVSEENLMRRGREPEKRRSRQRDSHGAPSVRKKKVRLSDDVKSEVTEQRSLSEPLRKGAHTSYKTKEKKKQQS